MTNAIDIAAAAECPAWKIELRALLRLAGPLVATQLAQMAIMTTDIVMLGRLGTEPLAASALGNTVYFFLWLIGMGPTAAVAPMIAHILGSRPHDRAGVRAVARMGLWIVPLMSLPLGLTMSFAPEILLLFGQDAKLSAAAGTYLLPLCFALPFSLGYQVLRNFATALERPQVPLYVMICTIFLNALFDYALIFGRLGAPRMELFGAGLASTCSLFCSFAAMTAFVLIDGRLRRFHLFRRLSQPDWPKFAELFRLGLPIGLTMIFEVSLFNAAALLMGGFGAAALAAHQIALNVASITFMVPLGLGMAATVRIGLAAGAEDFVGVRRAGAVAFAVSAGFMTLCAFVMAIFARGIAGAYFDISDPANAATAALTVLFLQVAAAFQIFDGLQVTAALSLRGLKDAHMPMWLAAISYWLFGFPTCIGLAHGLGMGGVGVWIGLAFALFLAAFLLGGRFILLSRGR